MNTYIKSINLATFILLFFISPLTYAHPGGHEGPRKVVNCKENGKCTTTEISEAGVFVFKLVAQNGQLTEDWDLNAAPKSTRQMQLQDQDVWVVNFENQNKNSSQKYIHVVISMDGLLIGVTSDISNLKEKQNYGTVIGIALILLVSVAVYQLIFRKNKKNIGDSDEMDNT